MAHTTKDSGTFIGGTHVLTPLDGSFGHGHQFRLTAPEEPLDGSESHSEALSEAAEVEAEAPVAKAPRSRSKAVQKAS